MHVKLNTLFINTSSKTIQNLSMLACMSEKKKNEKDQRVSVAYGRAVTYESF